MREFAKKVGSLALATGALALVLANAALQHGCASSQPTAVAEPGRDDMKPPDEVIGTERPRPVARNKPTAPPQPESGATFDALDDNGCDPSYMYATKAPVFLLSKCRPAGTGKSAASPSNAPQQAP